MDRLIESRPPHVDFLRSMHLLDINRKLLQRVDDVLERGYIIDPQSPRPGHYHFDMTELLLPSIYACGASLREVYDRVITAVDVTYLVMQEVQKYGLEGARPLEYSNARLFNALGLCMLIQDRVREERLISWFQRYGRPFTSRKTYDILFCELMLSLIDPTRDVSLPGELDLNKINSPLMFGPHIALAGANFVEFEKMLSQVLMAYESEWTANVPGDMPSDSCFHVRLTILAILALRRGSRRFLVNSAIPVHDFPVWQKIKEDGIEIVRIGRQTYMGDGPI
jgi:hypothetical protein